MAVAQLSQQLDDLRLERDVERARGLVGNQQRRLEQKRHRDHDALPHTARELVRVVVQALGGVRDPHLLEQLQCAAAQGSAIALEVRALHVDHLAPDGERRIQARERVLEDHRDLAAAQVAQVVQGQPAQVPVAEDHVAAQDLAVRR